MDMITTMRVPTIIITTLTERKREIAVMVIANCVNGPWPGLWRSLH